MARRHMRRLLHTTSLLCCLQRWLRPVCPPNCLALLRRSSASASRTSIDRCLPGIRLHIRWSIAMSLLRLYPPRPPPAPLWPGILLLAAARRVRASVPHRVCGRVCAHHHRVWCCRDAMACALSSSSRELTRANKQCLPILRPLLAVVLSILHARHTPLRPSPNGGPHSVACRITPNPIAVAPACVVT